MKTHTKKYTTYSINELEAEAKAKVLDRDRHINVDDTYWSDDIIEEFKSELFEVGFYDMEVSYSGFWSQGDGASFTASVDVVSWLDCHKAIKKDNRALYKDLKATCGCWSCDISKSGHYEHEMTMKISTNYYSDNEDLNDKMNALEDLVLEDAQEEARMFYKELENEYEYITSDEAVEENILANDYQFLKDGSTTLYIS